jgi:hypothetical protein
MKDATQFGYNWRGCGSQGKPPPFKGMAPRRLRASRRILTKS